MGSSQVISCTAITSTLLDVVFEWEGPEGDSITNDSRVIISQTTSINDTYISDLQFAYLMEEDEGNYTCTVSLMSAMSVSGSDSIQILNLIGNDYMYVYISYVASVDIRNINLLFSYYQGHLIDHFAIQIRTLMQSIFSYIKNRSIFL